MSTTLSADEKRTIRRAVLQRLGVEEDGMQDTLEQLDEASDVVRDEPTDESELAQQRVASDMQVMLEESDDRARAGAVAARDLDFAPTEVVEPGAIVGLDGQRYVVGVVVDEVEVDGVVYSGLSVDSPLYEAVQGLKSGEEYSFDGQKGTVEFVA